MVNRPKIAGTSAESLVCLYLRNRGWPYTKRLSLSGSKDVGDIDLHPALVLEVKATTGTPKIGPWMNETDIEQINAQAQYGILIIKYAGVGAKNTGKFLTVMRYGAAQHLIAKSGIKHQKYYMDYFGIKQEPVKHLRRLDRESLAVTCADPSLSLAMSMVVHKMRGAETGRQDYHFMWLEDRVTLLEMAGYTEKRTMNGYDNADQ